MTTAELIGVSNEHGCTVTSEESTITWTNGTVDPVTYLHVSKDGREVLYLNQSVLENWYDIRIIKHLFQREGVV